MTLAAVLRSGLHVPGIDAAGDWPKAAKRLAGLAWAIANRIQAAGKVGLSRALADDEVMLLCQGMEVLEAAADSSGDFFVGTEKRELSAFVCL